MEPRRCPRTAYRGWVELTLDGRRRRAEGCDLSVDGIGFEVDGQPPRVAAPLVTEFALPGIALPLELRGSVVWADPASGRAGVRFDPVDPGLADLLSNFVAGRLQA